MTHRRGKEEEALETDEERNIDLEIYNLFTSPSIAIEEAKQELEQEAAELRRRMWEMVVVLATVITAILAIFKFVLGG